MVGVGAWEWELYELCPGAAGCLLLVTIGSQKQLLVEWTGVGGEHTFTAL